MTITDWINANSVLIQAVSTVILAIVTGVYAFLTYGIGKATKQQAKASVKMAEEMREQRYKDTLPLLAPTLLSYPSEIALDVVSYEALQSGDRIRVMWRNVGKGVAINTRFSFWSAPTSPEEASFFPPRESGTLQVGGIKIVDYREKQSDRQLCDISDKYCPRLVAEYRDIYERKITTVQEFVLDKENNRSFIGELYFTINGRRLGKEIKNNDS